MQKPSASSPQSVRSNETSMQGSQSTSAVPGVPAVPVAQRKSARNGVLRVKHVYEHHAPKDLEVAEELAEIEDLESNDKNRAMCSLMHRLALDQSCDRYEDPLTGFEVFTSNALRQRECCGEVCRHCPHGHKNVPKRRLAAAGAQQRLGSEAKLTPPTHTRSRVDEAASGDSRSAETSRAASGEGSGEEGVNGSSHHSSSSGGGGGGGGSNQSESSRSHSDSGQSDSGQSDSGQSDSESDDDRAERSFEPLTEAELSAEARREAEAEGTKRALGFESVLHREACRAGRPGYIDPSTGAYVFTAAQLQARPCCGNGCRHCPHDHCCVPEYMRTAKREIALLDDSWDW